MLQPLSKKDSAILDLLTAGLTDFNARKYDNAPGTFMAASVEHIGPNRYSVAHYFEQNGDLVADPDLEFLSVDGKWYPAACQQGARYSVAVETDGAGTITGVRPRTYRSLRDLARLLLPNIKRQQGLRASR